MLPYYADSVGRCLGSLNPTIIPAGAVQTPKVPADETCTWNGADWLLTTHSRSEAMRQVDAAYGDRVCALAAAHPGLVLTFIGQLVEMVRSMLPGAPAKTAGAYPLVNSIVGVDAPNLATAFAVVDGTAAGWAALVAPSNTVRLQAKAQIAACTTSEELSAVLAGIVWP